MNKPDSGSKREADRRLMEMAQLRQRVKTLEKQVEALTRYGFQGDK